MSSQADRLAEHLRSGPQGSTAALVCARAADFGYTAYRIWRRVPEAEIHHHRMLVTHGSRTVRGFTVNSLIKMQGQEFEFAEFEGMFDGANVCELFSLLRPRIRPRGTP